MIGREIARITGRPIGRSIGRSIDHDDLKKRIGRGNSTQRFECARFGDSARLKPFAATWKRLVLRIPFLSFLSLLNCAKPSSHWSWYVSHTIPAFVSFESLCALSWSCRHAFRCTVCEAHAGGDGSQAAPSLATNEREHTHVRARARARVSQSLCMCIKTSHVHGGGSRLPFNGQMRLKAIRADEVSLVLTSHQPSLYPSGATYACGTVRWPSLSLLIASNRR